MTEQVFLGRLVQEVVDSPEAVARGLGLATVKAHAETLLQVVREGLLRDGIVRIHNFGTFRVKSIEAHRGVHPQTGEPIEIPRRARVVFSPAKALREAIEPLHPKAMTMAEPFPDNVVPLAAAAMMPPAVKVKPADDGPAEVLDAPSPGTTVADVLEEYPLAGRRGGLRWAKPALAAALVLALVSLWVVREPTVAPPAVPTPVARTAPAPAAVATPAPAVEPVVVSAGLSEDELRAEPKATPVAAEPEPFFSARVYVMREGNSLWRLSKRHYVHPVYWPHIYYANQYQIDNPNLIRIGDMITLPTLYGHPDALAAEDRRSIAEGYFLVYRRMVAEGHRDAPYALLAVAHFDKAVVDAHADEIERSHPYLLRISGVVGVGRTTLAASEATASGIPLFR